MKLLRSLCVLFSVALVTLVQTSDCNPFGPINSRSSPDEFIGQAYDVATGKRDLKINGNILNGDLGVTTSYTNEEIMELVAVGVAVLLILTCCCLCFKWCCCPNKPSTVIMYQRMPPSESQPQTVTTIIPGTHMVPIRNPATSAAPPPYPGFSN